MTYNILYKVIRSLEKWQRKSSVMPFMNLFVLLLSEILISFFDSYKEYLLYYITLNGLYFGITISKLILSTMTKTHMKIPGTEGVVYLVSILAGIVLPQYEVYIAIFQGVFIVLYYIYFYGRIISQMMRELNLKTF